MFKYRCKYREARHLGLFFRYLTQKATDLWLQSADLYGSDLQLRISLPNSHKTVDVKIVQAFTPFTNSVTLLVDTLGASCHLPARLILKLADRRFSGRCDPWNTERELDLRTNLPSHLKKFGECLKLSKFGPFTDDPLWIQELYYWRNSNQEHCVEKEAYERLAAAQSIGLVPRFFGPTRLAMSPSTVHPSLDHIDGLLLEYIPGRLMDSIKPGVDISEEEAENLSQKVLQLGRRLRRYGVTHSDVHLGNIILRSPGDDPVLIDWGRADVTIADAPLEVRWTYGLMHWDYHGDIRKVLAKNLWHRFSTPLADEQQSEYAANNGWVYINRKIAKLPAQQLQKFYYEDTSVSECDGLRWKVKKGVRTRLWDDPVPEA